MNWLLSPSGWPVFADTGDEQTDLLGRGYEVIAEADVQAAIDAFQAAEASPPSTQLPGWALATDVAAALATKANASSLGGKLSITDIDNPASDGGARLRAAFVAPIALRNPAPFRLNAANRVAAGTSFYRAIGHDPATGIMWFFRNGSVIIQTDDYGASFSSGRTLPTNVGAFNVATVVKLGANVYMLALETGTNTQSVFRATHVAQGGSWTWSGILTSMTSGAAPISHLSLMASAWGSGDVLVLSDYGDPVGGPVIKVSSDGTTWTTTFGPDASVRHIHHVNWDPYNPGHLWATLGDGTTKTLLRSTNYGQTWTVVVADSAWQGVQISFTATHVYLAGDSLQTSVVRVNKTTLVPEIPATSYHHDFVPPHIGGGGRRITDLVTVAGNAQVTSATAAFVAGDKGKYVISPNLPPRSYITGVASGTAVNLSQAPHISATAAAQISGDMYFANAFYGAVDPATGIYYGVAIDTSGPGTVHGVFFLPRTGEQMRLLDAGGIGIHPWGPTCVIAGGYLWVGSLKYPLLTVASVPA